MSNEEAVGGNSPSEGGRDLSLTLGGFFVNIAPRISPSGEIDAMELFITPADKKGGNFVVDLPDDPVRTQEFVKLLPTLIEQSDGHLEDCKRIIEATLELGEEHLSDQELLRYRIKLGETLKNMK